jgi:PAS domain S-box-containing protein
LIEKVFQTGQPQRYEASIPSPEGVLEEEVRFVPELSPEGSVAAVLAIGRDITERKRMERDLHQREQELAALFDNSPDVIVRRDRNLRNLYVNAAWEKLTGISRKMAIGKTSEELGLAQATVALQKRAIRHVLKTRSPLTVEFTYSSPKGPVDHEVRHIPEFDSSGVSSILSIGRDITEQKRLQTLAAANERDIRALSAGLITAQEQERRRIAREIHDSLLQDLGSLAAEIGGVASELPASSSARPRLQAARERAIRAAEEARHIASQLHPAILEDLGLPKALQSLCSEFSQHQGIPVKLRVSNPLAEATIEAASCVYRIAQEALNNVAKHSRAKNIWVRLSGTGNLHLSIQDDGIGFDVDSVRGAGGLGLVSMNERARIAGAKLAIRGHAGHGTFVDLVLPIRGVTSEKSAHSAGR